MAFNLVYVLTAMAITVWLAYKCLNFDLMIEEPQMESFSTFTDMKFELTIHMGATECSWTTTHHLMCRPEADTIKALTGESLETFIALYDFEPQRYSISLKQLEPDESESLVK